MVYEKMFLFILSPIILLNFIVSISGSESRSGLFNH